MKDHELEAIRARARYEAAAKVARNHPKSPYESQAERERSAQLARAREITQAQKSSPREWSNDYPSYVKMPVKDDGCLDVMLMLFGAGVAVAYVVARVAIG